MRRNLNLFLLFVSIFYRLTTFVNSSCVTTTPKFNLFSGIQNNVDFSIMQGTQVVYNKTYDYHSVSSDISNIRNGLCSASSILCAGCYADGNPNILVSVGCGYCFDVTKVTPSNTPNYYNGVYWYFTGSLSFGYSDVATIFQNQADVTDASDASKVSWHMDISYGGWRCGSYTMLNYANDFYKVIFLA